MIALSPACKQARSQGTLAALDAGPGAAEIRLYAAPRPAPGADPAAAAIAVLPLATPAGTVDADGLHLGAPAPVQVQTAGEPAWGRIVTGAGDWVIDGDVGSEFLIDTPGTLYPGAFVLLVAAVFTEGG